MHTQLIMIWKFINGILSMVRNMRTNTPTHTLTYTHTHTHTNCDSKYEPNDCSKSSSILFTSGVF